MRYFAVKDLVQRSSSWRLAQNRDAHPILLWRSEECESIDVGFWLALLERQPLG